MISNKIQRYNIGLISEAFTNEGRKVSNTQEGYPHEIVESILTEFLDTDKEITSDPSQNRLKGYSKWKESILCNRIYSG